MGFSRMVVFRGKCTNQKPSDTDPHASPQWSLLLVHGLVPSWGRRRRDGNLFPKSLEQGESLVQDRGCLVKQHWGHRPESRSILDGFLFSSWENRTMIVSEVFENRGLCFLNFNIENVSFVITCIYKSKAW